MSVVTMVSSYQNRQLNVLGVHAPLSSQSIIKLRSERRLCYVLIRALCMPNWTPAWAFVFPHVVTPHQPSVQCFRHGSSYTRSFHVSPKGCFGVVPIITQQQRFFMSMRCWKVVTVTPATIRRFALTVVRYWCGARSVTALGEIMLRMCVKLSYSRCLLAN